MPTNKNYQHRQPVETLSLSGTGDEWIIAQVQMLINGHTDRQPYSRNTLLRIKDLIDRYLGATHAE